MPVVIEYIHDDDGLGDEDPCPQDCGLGIWCDHQTDPNE